MKALLFAAIVGLSVGATGVAADDSMARRDTAPAMAACQAPHGIDAASAKPRLAACCKKCKKGKACGDSCISKSKTCHKAPGCACDGYGPARPAADVAL